MGYASAGASLDAFMRTARGAAGWRRRVSAWDADVAPARDDDDNPRDARGAEGTGVAMSGV